jgi:hypothetical protein
MEFRVGECLGHLDQRDGGPATDVGDLGARLQLGGDPVQAGQDLRDQARAEEGTEGALDADGGLFAEAVVRFSDAGTERFLETVDGSQQAHDRVEDPGAEQRTLLAREDLLGLRRQAEAIVSVLEHARGSLLPQPLQDPALVEIRRAGQLLAGRGARVGQRTVQPQLVSELDENTGECSVDLAEQLSVKLFHFLHVQLAHLRSPHPKFLL